MDSPPPDHTLSLAANCDAGSMAGAAAARRRTRRGSAEAAGFAPRVGQEQRDAIDAQGC